MDNDSPRARGLLTPIQQAFLRLFATLSDQEQFYLTGGTALAEYYLGHRLSYDLDFFTGMDELVQPVSFQLEKLAKKQSIDIQVVRRFSTYVEFMVSYQGERLKVDLALDSPFRFQPTLTCEPGFQVNNFTDLCVDKLLAYYGRAEPRDAVDLYFILQQKSTDELFEQVGQKDPGFDAYWFAVALNRCLDFPDEPERWPVNMLVDWHPKEIKSVFKAWSIRLMEGLKPEI